MLEQLYTKTAKICWQGGLLIDKTVRVRIKPLLITKQHLGNFR